MYLEEKSDRSKDRKKAKLRAKKLKTGLKMSDIKILVIQERNH